MPNYEPRHHESAPERSRDASSRSEPMATNGAAAQSDTVMAHAGRIEGIMGDLAAGHQAAAHQAWTNELGDLAKHDSDFLKSVLATVRKDAPATADIDLTQIPEIRPADNQTQMSMFRVQDGQFGLIGAITKNATGETIVLNSETDAGRSQMRSQRLGAGAWEKE